MWFYKECPVSSRPCMVTSQTFLQLNMLPLFKQWPEHSLAMICTHAQKLLVNGVQRYKG